MTDFATLYDELEEYVRRRDPASYNAQRIALEVAHYKIPNLLAVLPQNFSYRSIAEIGCATGEIIGAFPGTDVERRVGFDISPNNVQIAQQRFPEVTFIAGDFQRSTEKFDLVILSDILEHVPNDVEFLRAAAGLSQVVLVNLPLEKCLLFALRKYGPEDSSGHLRNYSLADGLKLFEAAGLTIINYQQKWSFESEYELYRQELNKRVWGTRFSGNILKRTVKTILYQLFSSSRWFRRITLSSNLFAAACLKE
ncbi:MAG: class I SAM-dependent methyltransferase [Anaerolineae bacterium]|nr:class I SAM-dependent methyltransferase [Anaerolineae bacterium]